MRKVRTNYENLTQNDFDEFLTHIQLCLKDNANFPALPVALDELSDRQKEWQKQLSLSRQGSHEATAEATIVHNELISKVKRNGIYINETAEDNVPKLESSGYWLTKEPVFQPKQDIKIVQDGVSGAGNVVIEAFPNAICYLVDFCPDPLPAPGNTSAWWRLQLSSKSTIPFSGLEPRKLYWMRFCYLSPDGETGYCQPKSFSVV